MYESISSSYVLKCVLLTTDNAQACTNFDHGKKRLTPGPDMSHSLPMGTLQRLVRRLSFLRDREVWEEQANEEMEFHLGMREKRNRENGMAPDEARNAALRAFGNPTQ